jgi:hypothetical protein
MGPVIVGRNRAADARTRPILLLAIVVFSVACAKEKPIVVIDHRWNTDYAKNACWRMKDSETPCVGDPTVDVNEFESQLVTSFASDPTCSRVAVVGPRGKTGLEPYWLLMLDFMPGKSGQNWGIVHTADGSRTRIREGGGDPKQIAHTVCAVVKQTGASVRD